VDIRLLDDPALRRPASPADPADPEIPALVETMVSWMRSLRGVGLAANQIGVDKAVIVYEDSGVPNGGAIGAMLNPRIVEASDDVELGPEGCFSIPDWWSITPRARRILVEGLNPAGDKVRREAEGFLARIFQHEIGHLEGRLFVDGLGREAVRSAKRHVARLRKKQAKGGRIA
jgi:peptide deformylase